jgi:hypothetical protein
MFGQREAVEALVAAGIDVDSRDDAVRAFI